MEYETSHYLRSHPHGRRAAAVAGRLALRRCLPLTPLPNPAGQRGRPGPQGGRTSGGCWITTCAGHVRPDRYKHSLAKASGRLKDAGQGTVALGNRAGGGPRSPAAVQEPAAPLGRCLGRGLLRRAVRLRGLRRTANLWPQEGGLFPAFPRTSPGYPLARHISAGLPSVLSDGVATL